MPPTFVDPNKKPSEEDIKRKYITPAILKKWNDNDVRMEFPITDGMITVRDNVVKRENKQFADYVLLYNAHIIAIVEAKNEDHEVGSGMQQALGYAEKLDVPFVYSSNGHGFLEHLNLTDVERSRINLPVERELPMDAFPGPDDLWNRYCQAKGYSSKTSKEIATNYYYSDEFGERREPRYYQQIAISKTVDAIASGVYPGGVDNRILLVMATGSGKTYTAFQIIHRLREAKLARRILYLADRNVLIDQTMKEDFKPFSKVMVKVTHKKMDSAFEIYMSLYQQQIADDEEDDTYKQFKPEFFDLIIVDECHRGSADENSNWRRILEYFSSAVQIGMTATPKETNHISNIDYFGEPLYTYTLRQGIEDGYLAPYKIIQVNLDKDIEGWTPQHGTLDLNGNLIPDKTFKRQDFDKELVIDSRTAFVAERTAQELEKLERTENGRHLKTMVFCDGVDHAERMRQALVNCIGGEAATNRLYVMRITGDDAEGKKQLDNFNDVHSELPVIATTSDLLTTGVNCKTCHLIVLDKTIASATELKQIVGRGTRLYPPMDKYYFTILDFKGATEMFADPDFMGDPIPTFIGAGKKPTGKPSDKPKKKNVVFRVHDVDVQIVSEKVQYYGIGGKLVTESFTDFTKKTILDKYATLDDFLKSWNEKDKSEIISQELELQGVFLDKLRKEIGNPNMDDFDIICHLAYGTRPITKQQRVSRVKNAGYLDTYSGVARKVLDTLLELYSSESGDAEFTDMDILKLPAIQKIAKPYDIVNNIFGGKEQFMDVMTSLRKEVYAS